MSTDTDGRFVGSGGERVTVNLTGRTSRALDAVTNLSGLNKTDTINRAVQLYAYLEDVSENGGEIFVQPIPGAAAQILKIF